MYAISNHRCIVAKYAIEKIIELRYLIRNEK